MVATVSTPWHVAPAQVWGRVPPALPQRTLQLLTRWAGNGGVAQAQQPAPGPAGQAVAYALPLPTVYNPPRASGAAGLPRCPAGHPLAGPRTPREHRAAIGSRAARPCPGGAAGAQHPHRPRSGPLRRRDRGARWLPGAPGRGRLGTCRRRPQPGGRPLRPLRACVVPLTRKLRRDRYPRH
jgi:hypothetical protein